MPATQTLESAERRGARPANFRLEYEDSAKIARVIERDGTLDHADPLDVYSSRLFDFERTALRFTRGLAGHWVLYQRCDIRPGPALGLWDFDEIEVRVVGDDL